ncbi:MAG: cupredoxin domain-containing protein [Gaiellaceae bacterium]
MKKLTIVLAAGVALIASAAAIAVTTDVEISKSGFAPKDVTVEAGNALSFKNTDTVAHAVVVDKTTCNLALQPQQSSECTFATPGTFSYDDPTTTDPAFGGKVTVAPAAQRTVTLAANRNIAIFGDSVTLSGAASGKTAGETVTVVARPANEPAASINVTTTANGAWSLRVQPRVRTEYQVTYGNVSSGKLVVSVRPRITLQKVGADKFLIVVLSNKGLAGKSVQLTRFVPGTGWVPLGDVQLTSIARTDSVAVKTVTSLVSRGTKLRVLMTAAQAGAEYIDAQSNFVVK